MVPADEVFGTSHDGAPEAHVEDERKSLHQTPMSRWLWKSQAQRGVQEGVKTDLDDGRTVTLRLLAGPAVSVAAAAVWFAIATSNPTSTYHFAPPVVTVAWPAVQRSLCGRSGPTQAALASIGGFGIAMVALGALAIVDSLQGPTFWSESGAAWEAVIFAAGGALWGFRILSRDKAGLLFG